MEKLIHKVADWIIQQDENVIVGISGHGASGKSTFATMLVNYLGKDIVNYLNTDPYIVDSQLRRNTMITYEYENEEHHYKMTACHPAAHHLPSLERDVQMIKKGMDLYTIDTSYLKSTLLSSKNKVTVVEGMSVAFVDSDLFDLNVYLYTDGDTEFTRRSQRDISERGMELSYLKHSHEERRIQYEVFMHGYHKNFDIVVKNSNDEFVVEKDHLKE